MPKFRAMGAVRGARVVQVQASEQGDEGNLIYVTQWSGPPSLCKKRIGFGSLCRVRLNVALEMMVQVLHSIFTSQRYRDSHTSSGMYTFSAIDGIIQNFIKS